MKKVTEQKVTGKKALARLQFANWVKENHPNIFQRAIAIAAKGDKSQSKLGAVGDEPTQSFWQKFGTAALGFGTTILSLKNQRDVMKINLARAQAGQPPIDMATSAPVVRTQVDLSPELTNRLLSTAGEGISKTLLFAGAGLTALLLFMRKK